MGKQFVIPSIFTAIDKYTAPVAKMMTVTQAFGKKAEANLARLDRKMRPIGKQALVIGTAAAAPLALFANEARKYEDAVASFRTIVSDLSNKDFKQYEDAIKSVGDKTKSTYTDVASSFERIAGLNADFAKTSEGISKVTEATITLSRASGMDLETSAMNLVGIMNQFSLSATESARAINVLAAGQAVGAASITQTSESFVNLGSVAAGANISLEQSVALVQLMGKYSLFGAEAGTKLRGSILKLQQSGNGYKSGQFKINDALEETRKRYDQLGSAKQKDAYLNKLFGAENVTAGRILLTNIGLFKDFTAKVTGTNEAQKAADIRQRTFTERMKMVKAQVQNLAVNLGEKLLPILSSMAQRLIPIIESMAQWAKDNPKTVKTLLAITAGVVALSYTISGISGIIAIATKAMGIFNFVMGLNPVFLIITGVTLLGVGIYALVKSMETYTAAERVTNQVRERALENTLDQRTEVKLLFAALRKATVGTEQYQSILAKIEAMQPGITKQYNLQAGAIQSINEAEKELTKSIMERAMMEARAEILKEKTKELLKAEQEGPTGWDKFKSAISHVGPMGKFGRSAEAFKNSRISEIQEEINILADQVAADQSKAAMSAKGQQAETSSIIQTNNANVNLNVNDPGGFIKTWESNSPFVNVNTSRSKKLP